MSVVFRDDKNQLHIIENLELYNQQYVDRLKDKITELTDKFNYAEESLKNLRYWYDQAINRNSKYIEINEELQKEIEQLKNTVQLENQCNKDDLNGCQAQNTYVDLKVKYNKEYEELKVKYNNLNKKCEDRCRILEDEWEAEYNFIADKYTNVSKDKQILIDKVNHYEKCLNFIYNNIPKECKEC